jgi:hypothetical protein
MTKTVVQEHLGEAIVGAIVEFARHDIETVAQLEQVTFAHVADASLRRSLARTLYGAKWLYKLGLVTLSSGDERVAHVRVQINDYGAICEALLHDVIAVGILGGVMVGPATMTDWYGKPLTWGGTDLQVRQQLRKRCGFAWLIRVALDERVVTPDLADRLDKLRMKRNAVHLAEAAVRGDTYYLNLSKKSSLVLDECIRATRAWRQKHP